MSLSEVLFGKELLLVLSIDLVAGFVDIAQAVRLVNHHEIPCGLANI